MTHSDIASRWKRLEPILDGALDLAPAERDAYLDRMCESADTRTALAELLRGDAPRDIPLAIEWAAAIMRGDKKVQSPPRVEMDFTGGTDADPIERAP